MKRLLSYIKRLLQKKPEIKTELPTEVPKTEDLFKQLAKTYCFKQIEFNDLKYITLAQWILESGRGSSDLAQIHLNFAGLKWRTEMSSVATKVFYEAHDGGDEYCKFSSLENFIEGYWTFIGRKPYEGWKQHGSNPEEFLRFIVKAGYCPVPGYEEKVLALVPEAKELIDSFEQENRDNEEDDREITEETETKYENNKGDLWYPKAIIGTKKQVTKGNYAKGYPRGAVVHFTAGRSRDAERGGRNNKETESLQGLDASNYSIKQASYTYFVIDRAGNVYQNFPLNRWGYHAGASSLKGIVGNVSNVLVGIEMTNAGKLDKKGDVYHAWFTKIANGDKVFTEEEVRYSPGLENQKKGYYHKYSEAQEKALTELLIWLKRNNPDVFELEMVVGHDEVAPDRKSDPGASLSCTMPAFRGMLISEYKKRYS